MNGPRPGVGSPSRVFGRRTIRRSALLLTVVSVAAIVVFAKYGDFQTLENKETRSLNAAIDERPTADSYRYQAKLNEAVFPTGDSGENMACFGANRTHPGYSADIEWLLRDSFHDNPEDCALKLWLAAVLLRQGKTQSALQQYSEVIATCPENADAHFGRGNALLLSEEYDLAIEDLRKAVLLDDENAYFNLSLARALFQVGFRAEAHQFLNRAIELDPTYASVRLNAVLRETALRE